MRERPGRRAGRSMWTLTVLLAVLLGWVVTASAAEAPLVLATTEDLADSGLLNVLIPRFEQVAGLTVRTRALAVAEVFALGRRGEADCLLADSPADGEAFMSAGHGGRRRTVMAGRLAVVGPADDPAKIKGLGPARAFAAVARSGSPFVSKGDRSGIHQRELEIWQRANVTPAGPWYIEAPAGAGNALRLAAGKRGYALIELRRSLALGPGTPLSVLLDGFKVLESPYSLIEVNQARHPRVNAGGAKAFGDFLQSPEARALIDAFGRDRYGQPVFVPDPGS